LVCDAKYLKDVPLYAIIVFQGPNCPVFYDSLSNRRLWWEKFKCERE